MSEQNDPLPNDPRQPQTPTEDLSEALRELAAGYVLGDLASEEAEQFHQLMSQNPALKAEVHSLQQALELMPYALPEENPRHEVRSKILQAVQAEINSATLAPVGEIAPPNRKLQADSPTPFSSSPVGKLLRKKLTWLIGGIAIGYAAALGFNALKTARLGPSLATTSTPTRQATQIDQVWLGFHDLSQDHNNALREIDGPVDFTVQSVSEIPDQVKYFPVTLATLPVLPESKGKLLGGSNCKLGKTAGLRLSYQVDMPLDTSSKASSESPSTSQETSQIVSVYQLEPNEEQFPGFYDSYITSRQPDGTTIVLWREERYVYALVADLPLPELSSLAQSITPI